MNAYQKVRLGLAIFGIVIAVVMGIVITRLEEVGMMLPPTERYISVLETTREVMTVGDVIRFTEMTSECSLQIEAIDVVPFVVFINGARFEAIRTDLSRFWIKTTVDGSVAEVVTRNGVQAISGLCSGGTLVEIWRLPSQFGLTILTVLFVAIIFLIVIFTSGPLVRWYRDY